MKFSVLVMLFLVLYSCENKNKSVVLQDEKVTSQNLIVQKIKPFDLEVYDFEGFKPFLSRKDDKIYVINFWATWCTPCVKELPYFEKLREDYKDKNVEVLLVSLDFPHLYETKLKPFILNHKIKSRVIALDDTDTNNWIPKVSDTWTGSIPATVIYKNDKRMFYEQSFTYEELRGELQQFLN